MKIRLLLNSPLGQKFISILLGLGLATFFRQVCQEKNCLKFRGPILSEIDGKIYKHGGKCYRYDIHSSGTCSESGRKVIDVSTEKPEDKGDPLF